MHQWDPEIWSPGMILPVHVEEDSAWLSGVSSFQQLRDSVNAALNDWSSIETADVRWEIRNSPTGLEHGITISIQENLDATGFARITSQTVGDSNFVQHCEITRNATGFSPEDVDPYLRIFIRHELYHCLGLHHPNPYPYKWFAFHDNRRVSVWGDPTELIDLDFQTGVSLLRPAAGWYESTGRIVGTVLTEDSRPAQYVSVLATRQNESFFLEGGVKRLTDLHGRFAIDGLQPGTYFLYVYPLSYESRPWNELPSATREVRPTARLNQIIVQAGKTTGPEVVVVRTLKDIFE